VSSLLGSFWWSSHSGPHQSFALFLFFLQTGEEISTLWLDDGHKTYKKTEIKLSVKAIYSATKKGECGVRGVHTLQNWHPSPLTKTIDGFPSSLPPVYTLRKDFCGTTKFTCPQN